MMLGSAEKDDVGLSGALDVGSLMMMEGESAAETTQGTSEAAGPGVTQLQVLGVSNVQQGMQHFMTGVDLAICKAVSPADFHSVIKSHRSHPCTSSMSTHHARRVQ
jgi:hypothetical protein